MWLAFRADVRGKLRLVPISKAIAYPVGTVIRRADTIARVDADVSAVRLPCDCALLKQHAVLTCSTLTLSVHNRSQR
jgi:hypothetical protein